MTTKTIEKVPVTETIPVKTPLFPLLDPWGQFSRMRNLMDEMMTEFFRPEALRLRVFRETFRPELNLYKHDGNLVLEATTNKQVGEEKEKVTLTGVARQADVSGQNTIKAEKLANLGLKVEGDGPIGDVQQRGWLSKVLDAIWPF